jgi:hypothetical protein
MLLSNNARCLRELHEHHMRLMIYIRDMRATGDLVNTFNPPIKKPAVLIMPRSEKPSPMKRSYGAGLADGEGCIQIIKQKVPGRRNPSYRLRFEMMQNDFRTLEHFVHCVGIEAKIRLVNRDREGKQNRQVWRLAYDGPQAYAVIRCLQRYLVRKGPEAQVAREFVEKGRIGMHPGPSGTPRRYWQVREACFKKLRKLK